MPAYPGLAAQEKFRNAFRAGGVVCLLLGVVLTAVGLLAFVSMFSHADQIDAGFDTNFFWAFLGLPLLGLGSMMLKIGFLGAGARYVAGETMPVVRDSASYLSGGQGLAGIGREGEGDKHGPFCSACGVRNDADAHFCDACGAALTRP